MWRRVAVVAGLISIVGLALAQLPASADHGTISVPIDTVVRAGQGEVVQLDSTAINPELVGATCEYEFHSTNQESVNPGNDLILSTGGTETVIPGVEDAPDQELDVAGSVTLGETLTVSVRIGPNEIFSAGLSVELVCDIEDVPSTTSTTAPETTTTTAPETTTTAEPDRAATTTAAPTTTTPTSTTVEVEVADLVETAPNLAVTGPSSATYPLVALAFLLLLCGAAALSIRGPVRR